MRLRGENKIGASPKSRRHRRSSLHPLEARAKLKSLIQEANLVSTNTNSPSDLPTPLPAAEFEPTANKEKVKVKEIGEALRNAKHADGRGARVGWSEPFDSWWRNTHNELSCKQMNERDNGHWLEPNQRPWLAQLTARWINFSLGPLSRFQHIDSFGGWNREFLAGIPVLAAYQFPEGQTLSLRLRNFCRGPILAQIVRLFFFYFSLKLIILIRWQHIYCQHFVTIKRLNTTLQNLLAQELPGHGQQQQQQQQHQQHQQQQGRHLMTGSGHHLNSSQWQLQRSFQIKTIGNQLEIETKGSEEAEAVVKSIGNPFYSFGYAYEAANIYAIIMAYLVYMHTQLFFRFFRPFSFSLMRALMSGKLEQKFQTNRMICDQVNKFIVSSENFFRNCLNDLARAYSFNYSIELDGNSLEDLGGAEGAQVDEEECSATMLGGSKVKSDKHYVRFRREAKGLIERHKGITGHLKRLALEGKLQPPNRNREWLQLIARLNMFISLLVLICGHILINLLFVVVPTSGLFSPRNLIESRADELFMVELYLYSMLILVSLIFYIPVIIGLPLDQIKYVQTLSNKVELAIRANDVWLNLQASRLHAGGMSALLPIKEEVSRVDHRLCSRTGELGLRQRRLSLLAKNQATHSSRRLSRSLSSGELTSATTETLTADNGQLLVPETPNGRQLPALSGQRRTRTSHELNTNLLLILMQLKIFVSEQQSIQSILGFGATMCLILMCLVPILGRLLIGHFEFEMRLLLLFSGLIFLVYGDTIIAPMCYLHSRCLELYRRLSHLLAHSIEVIYIHGNCDHLNGCAQVYDDHTIWLLRKELKLPERGLDRFATRSLMLDITWGTFMRIHFWCGLLLTSIMLSQESSGDAIEESLRFL